MKNHGSLRRTLLLAFILVIALLSAINFFSLQFMYRNHRDTENLLDTIFHITTLSTMLGENHQVITNAINYRDTGLVDRFVRDIEGTVTYVANLDRAVLAFAREVKDMNAYYKFLEIQKSILTYRDKSLVLTRKFLSAAVDRVELYDALYELRSRKDSVSDLQNDLLFRQSVHIQEFYGTSRIQMMRGLYVLIGVTVGMLVLCIWFSLLISRRISIPIHRMGEAAAAVGSGTFTRVEPVRGTNREIASLIDSFNRMTVQLKTRQDVERQLQEEVVKNLRIENLLGRSEMKLLQSRIHPHFLFNTLHMIAALTQIEEAPRTREMLDSLSSLLRYILKKADQLTSLSEELTLIDDYMTIQTARFGDRISCEIRIEEGLEQVMLPALSLQPFVENSIIHGLEPKKGSGRLSIRCRSVEPGGRRRLEVVIADDGVGMDAAALERIRDPGGSMEEGAHLGIANTVRRLELFSEEASVVIDSEPGSGTAVQLLLPIVREAT